jgi:cbb3-type cytochrome oxidase subunit 3
MTVLKEGASMAQMGWMMGVMTVAFMVAMVSWIVWTWWPSRKAAFDAAARMPLEEV